MGPSVRAGSPLPGVRKTLLAEGLSATWRYFLVLELRAVADFLLCNALFRESEPSLILHCLCSISPPEEKGRDSPISTRKKPHPGEQTKEESW